MASESLDEKAIADLRQLCQYLDSLPRKSAYYTHLGAAVEEAAYWVLPSWKQQRQYADCIFYSSGWGWRLRKHWRDRLAQLEAELLPHPQPDDAVLGGQSPPQPQPDDAVLGGQ